MPRLRYNSVVEPPAKPFAAGGLNVAHDGGVALDPLPALDPLRARAGPTPCLIGVAGGTGSGKTTVVRAILEAVGEDRIAFIEQDSYYRDVDWRSEADLLQYNFDHPSAIDHGLLVAHLAALRAGHPVEVPIYDFVRHRRTPRTRRVKPRPVALLEGILIFVDAELREMLDLKIYVDADADLRLIRRLGRDMSERGRSVQDVLRQYLVTVRPMHLEFVEPSKRFADVIIPAGGENPAALAMVVARVEKLLEGR
jgi:uridine kinase